MANINAKVSSIPGSQSIITFRIISNLLSVEILSFLFWEVSEPVQGYSLIKMHGISILAFK
ncbi:hypothetical protein K2D_10060 [Enterococcus hirae]|nr:hypothetical protein K2D_10060 [Enterococcus hirae]